MPDIDQKRSTSIGLLVAARCLTPNRRVRGPYALTGVSVPSPQELKDCVSQLEMENLELRNRAVELALEIQALEERILRQK
jgi:hypothetical protein